jgi:dihydropteroate synthase
MGTPSSGVAVMGILNVTPDSFSDGGRYLDADAAIAHGLDLVRQGAAIVDVGGESTRPRAVPVDPSEEHRRVLPVVTALVPHVRVSIDTRHAAVAESAIAAGATLVNDVSASLWPVAAAGGAGWIAMHMQGDPGTMQDDPRYDDVVAEVASFLEERLAFAVAAGIAEHRIWIDPGIGFGKTLEHNLALLRHLDELVALGFPVLVGASRKSFLGRITGVEEARDRVPGTVAANVIAYEKGATLFRVHDVRANREALAVARAILDA